MVGTERQRHRRPARRRPRTGLASGWLPWGMILLLGLLILALSGPAAAQGLPVRPVLDADNGVVGLELYTGAGPWEVFTGGGYGLFSGRGHYGVGVSHTGPGQQLTLLYRDWPGSLVEGRDGQTGTGLRWTWSPAWGPTVHLNAFQGALWTHDERLNPERVWLVTGEASYAFRLGNQWLLTPRLTSVYGRSLETENPFTSHLLTARLRRGWTGLQLAAGHLWTHELAGFRWELGGGGKVPLRGYEPGFKAGEWLVGASLEHRVPLPWETPLAQLQVAFFIDTADALAAHESLRELDLATGYGLGLVIATPLGELHGDLGWNPEGKMVPSVWLSAAF